MELSKWKRTYKKFKIKILERGHEYYKDNKVLSHSALDDGVFEGKVSGSNNEVYNVKLNLKYFKESTCDCPYGEKGNKCKHLAALYFALYGDDWYQDYLDEVYLPYQGPYDDYNLYYEEELEKYLEERIDEYVDSLTKKELKDVLKNLLRGEEEYIKQLKYEFYEEIMNSDY